MDIQNDLKEFCEFATKLGAFAAKPIRASDIAVDDWVRLKCQYGCGGYNTRFSCPPYTPTPTQTRQMIKKYEWAILIGFSLPLEPYKDIKDYDYYKRLLQTKLFAIERTAFLAGYYKAFCFFSGPRMLCHPKECRKRPTNIADLVRFRILGHQLPCRNPRMSRPAMEGCGINVYATAQKAELPIKVLTSPREIPHNY